MKARTSGVQYLAGRSANRHLAGGPCDYDGLPPLARVYPADIVNMI